VVTFKKKGENLQNVSGAADRSWLRCFIRPVEQSC